MKRIIPLMFLSAPLVLLLAGCGSSNHVTTPVGPSNLTIQTGDAMNDQVVKFELTVTSIVLTGTGGTSNTPNLLSRPTEVEFEHEAGTFEPLSLANVPQGTYSGATIMVSNPEVVAVVNGVPTKLTATLSSSTINVTFTSNITVGTSPIFVNFDLSLANSLTINGTLATIAPSFTVTTSTVAADENNENEDNGEIEDVHGTVTNVTAPNFTIQTSQSMITFATDNNTQFRGGLTAVTDIKVGDVLEVDGMTKADGTKLATKVEREETSNGQEVEGMVSAVTGSPATQITVATQVGSAVNSTSPVTVDVQVTANTQFVIRPDKLNVDATIPVLFDASHIAKGQRVEVDTSSTSTPLVADRIKLREEALMGTVSNAMGNTFTLTVNSTSAFAVLSGTTMVNVIMLNGFDERMAPMNGATVRVRGLVFVNGTTFTMAAVRSDNNN